MRGESQQTHRRAQCEDNQAYFYENEPLWNHAALAMGYKDAKEFSEKAREMPMNRTRKTPHRWGLLQGSEFSLRTLHRAFPAPPRP